MTQIHYVLWDGAFYTWLFILRRNKWDSLQKLYCNVLHKTEVCEKRCLYNIVAAFPGMQVSPAKHSYVWLLRKCEYWTDRQTDRRRTKWSLCADTLPRQHKKDKVTMLPIFLYTGANFKYFCLKMQVKLKICTECYTQPKRGTEA